MSLLVRLVLFLIVFCTACNVEKSTLDDLVIEFDIPSNHKAMEGKYFLIAKSSDTLYQSNFSLDKRLAQKYQHQIFPKDVAFAWTCDLKDALLKNQLWNQFSLLSDFERVLNRAFEYGALKKGDEQQAIQFIVNNLFISSKPEKLT